MWTRQMGRGAVLASCALLSAASPAHSQTRGPERGILLSAQAGDIACHVEIRDEAGRRASWMAAFELCEGVEAMIGRRFALTWQAGTVQHRSCQGNPDCRRSQPVMLLSAMRFLAP